MPGDQSRLTNTSGCAHLRLGSSTGVSGRSRRTHLLAVSSDGRTPRPADAESEERNKEEMTVTLRGGGDGAVREVVGATVIMECVVIVPGHYMKTYRKRSVASQEEI